jgi:hypothetical protein
MRKVGDLFVVDCKIVLFVGYTADLARARYGLRDRNFVWITDDGQITPMSDYSIKTYVYGIK